MMELLVIITFGLLNAARGQGLLPRIAMCVLMAICIQTSHYVSFGDYNLYKLAGLFLALYAAFVPAWSLSAITGTFNGKTPEQDWNDKFKPSGFTISKLKVYNLLPKALQSEYTQGAIGTSVRWQLFIPACIITQGWIGVAYGVLLSILVGFIYWLAGRTLRGTKYATHAIRLSEFGSGCLLGLALFV